MWHRVDAMRLDEYLTAQGYFASRSKAQSAILAGEVWLDGKRLEKSGQPVRPPLNIELRPSRPPYVSRGGYKLEHALTRFEVDPKGLFCLDIGASTGGFTDVLLQHGAARVVAVDVGYGQLAQSLRDDPRVVVLERTNARTLHTDLWGGARADLATVDVSFISLRLILPALTPCLNPPHTIITLIKPQFEAGPREAKHGVVRGTEVHLRVLRELEASAREFGLWLGALSPSPILGPKGNAEFLALWRRQPPAHPPLLEDAVAQAALLQRGSAQE